MTEPLRGLQNINANVPARGGITTSLPNMCGERAGSLAS
jgi:hypothetical protein